MAKAQNNPVKNEAKNDLVIVKFTRNFTPYLKGEVAGVSKKIAKQLFENEIAEKFGKGGNVEEVSEEADEDE